ncbi:MAG: PD40 domain-containing protein, partial [Leptospira sp.]|nr:PD40 domain-containing protein [Leptospira sp.]
MKKIRYSLYILFFHIFFLGNCSLLFYRNASVQPVDFDYKKIASIHFNENNLHPFPLTVKKGVNSYASTDREARYLFFAGNGTGNFNIYFRDLHTSVTVPITLHPSEETKPAISPDGKRLAFVSERYDSNGDILVLEVDPEYLKEKYLKGNRVTAQDKTINATSKDNPRAIDTDPTWSSDGRYILFVTDRFTPGTTNVAVIDTLNDYKITQITQNGAASPSFSHDGKSIFYVSYKDHKLGEIYRIDIGKKEEIRITFNDFKDLSPSLSPDGKSLIYTSIRRDTNRNGRLDSGDHASVIKHYFENQKEVELTPGTYSLFDTRYSTLNGGSILFTAGINNALNVYFIPIDGVIPKRNNPREQYKQSLKYENTHSYYYRTAVESIQNFHPDDELSPLFIAKAELNLLKEYLKEGRNSEYNELKST